jgi:lysozyme family protein
MVVLLHSLESGRYWQDSAYRLSQLESAGGIMKTVDEMIGDIIRREGGFVNHPADKGGPTKYGITIRTLENWRRRPVGVDDVRRLTKKESSLIYRHNYYAKPNIDKLPIELQPVVFDMAVNMGPKQAIKILQTVIVDYLPGISIDGVIGSKTLDAIDELVSVISYRYFIHQITEERIKFYRNIVKRDPSQIVFLNGWENRAREFLA